MRNKIIIVVMIVLIISLLIILKGFCSIKYDLDENDTIKNLPNPSFTGTVTCSTIATTTGSLHITSHTIIDGNLLCNIYKNKTGNYNLADYGILGWLLTPNQIAINDVITEDQAVRIAFKNATLTYGGDGSYGLSIDNSESTAFSTFYGIGKNANTIAYLNYNVGAVKNAGYFNYSGSGIVYIANASNMIQESDNSFLVDWNGNMTLSSIDIDGNVNQNRFESIFCQVDIDAKFRDFTFGLQQFDCCHKLKC
jgi:hypothetical protein